MKWFKHQADANLNAKLQEIILDHGMEGYGLYWFCLELVAMNVTSSKLTFELEHDARIIARMTGLPASKIQSIMTQFIELDLFSASEGRIQCLKLAKRCDDFTAKAVKQNGVQVIENKEVRQNPTNSDKVHLEDRSKNIEVIKEIEDKRDSSLSSNDDAITVLEYLNAVCGTKYKKSTKSHIQNINARLSDGYTVDECKAVIDSKNKQWGSDQKMSEYLRPQTLFHAGKFQGYLKSAQTVSGGLNQIGTNFDKPEGWQ